MSTRCEPTKVPTGFGGFVDVGGCGEVLVARIYRDKHGQLQRAVVCPHCDKIASWERYRNDDPPKAEA